MRPSESGIPRDGEKEKGRSDETLRPFNFCRQVAG
jgi:hypothetical protein